MSKQHVSKEALLPSEAYVEVVGRGNASRLVENGGTEIPRGGGKAIFIEVEDGF